MDDKFPKVLLLDNTGVPLYWATYEMYATLKAKDRVLWSTGTYACTLRGGTNAITGKQSILVMDTIVAIKHEKKQNKNTINYNPTLTNKMLFERDNYECSYCGHSFLRNKLTRDHIIPISKNGKDNWLNCTTACNSCNLYKDDKTLEEVGMVLLKKPYKPSFHEHLILKNRKLLPDQLQFLIKGVSSESLLYKEYMQKEFI